MQKLRHVHLSLSSFSIKMVFKASNFLIGDGVGAEGQCHSLVKTIIKIFWVLFSRICLPIFCLPAYLESLSQVFNLHKQNEQSGWTNKVMQKNISYIYLGMENVRLCVCLDRQNESSKKFCLVKNKTQGWEPWERIHKTS